VTRWDFAIHDIRFSIAVEDLADLAKNIAAQCLEAGNELARDARRRAVYRIKHAETKADRRFEGSGTQSRMVAKIERRKGIDQSDTQSLGHHIGDGAEKLGFQHDAALNAVAVENLLGELPFQMVVGDGDVTLVAQVFRRQPRFLR
jgi:hypothetical protein